jgi:hypothetical protein
MRLRAATALSCFFISRVASFSAANENLAKFNDLTTWQVVVEVLGKITIQDL